MLKTARFFFAALLCTCSITISFANVYALVVTPSQTDVKCYGQSTGTATVSVSGGTEPYTYLWSPSGGTNATATGLAHGNYTCTITDANAITTTQSFTINQPAAALHSSTYQTDVSCYGGSDATANANSVGGGTPPYTFLWLPYGGTTAFATGLYGGSDFSCTITDANNCVQVRTFYITEPTHPLSATTSQTDISCNGSADGTATVLVSGGTYSYSYSWAPYGGTAATATGLVPDTYTCTIKDYRNCTTTASVTIVQGTCTDNLTKTDQQAIQVYPNPVREILTILHAPEHAMVKLLSMNGRELISTTQTEISTEQLPSGIYLLLVETSEGKSFRKIIKE